MFDRFSFRQTVGWMLMVCALLIVFSACGRGGKLPDPSSQEYRDTVKAFYIGLSALQAGDDRRAEDELTKAAQLAPGEPAVWADLGMLSLKGRDFPTAAQRFDKARALAPDDSRIVLAQATLASAQGNSADAVKYLRKAIELDPKSIRANYSLAEELEREGGDQNEAEAEKLMQKIVEVHPGNLAVLLEVVRLAAKRGDTATVQSSISKIAADTSSWPQEAKDELASLQVAASGSDTRIVGQRVAFLRNVLVRFPGYRTSVAAAKAPVGDIGEPFVRFLKLPSPSPKPAVPDDGLAYTEEPVPDFPNGSWSWAGTVSLDGQGTAALIAANGKHVSISGALLPFPGGSAATAPTAAGVVPLDFNYDFKTDLALAGAGGFKLYRQESNGTLADATAATKLPAASLNRPYWGAWAADIEMDGDLDIVLAPVQGPPVVFRNNGDSTFTEMQPFKGITNVRGFAWADFDADGDPDAAFVTEDGKVHVFANQRGASFRERSVPPGLPAASAIGVADVNGDSILDLIIAAEGGRILSLSDKGDGVNWIESGLVDKSQDGIVFINNYSTQLLVADLDNNGSSDIVYSTPVGTSIWLSDGTGKFTGLPSIPAQVFSASDLSGSGRLDLVGVTKSGQAVKEVSRGSKDYHWVTFRPRAATGTGDQRINSFGLGGEMEIRSGLLFQKQSITSPVVHFGLGENTGADVLRIVWPNGYAQAEFDLKSDQTIVANQRLKGSCPSLFAWDGHGMSFVKDCAPWSAAIGLSINASQTAAITQTEEWVKIRGDQLVPKDGYYDLRITAELWELYYIDYYALMVVDHPDNNDVFVDERTSNPPPKLGLYTTGHPQPIKAAWDDTGQDVTDIVRNLDGRYLDTFGRGQYQGLTRDHYVEIELGDNAPTEGPLYLIAQGWLHPTDATVNIAMSQGSAAPPHGLSIEVPDANGKWVTARDNLGFPAGKNKILVFDLTGIFHPGAPKRLRLRTNMEIYWDQFQWAAGKPDSEVKTTTLSPATAELRYRGFSKFTKANPSSPDLPDYNQIVTTGQRWRDLIGYYTRYGDIRELVDKVDDRIVIVNAGDEMAFRFAAPPPPPAGWTRDFVLIGDGWIKDGDLNSVFSKTVLPLPAHDIAKYTTLPARLEDDPVYRRHPSDWQEYHTRYVTPEQFQETLTIKKEGQE